MIISHKMEDMQSILAICLKQAQYFVFGCEKELALGALGQQTSHYRFECLLISSLGTFFFSQTLPLSECQNLRRFAVECHYHPTQGFVVEQGSVEIL